MLAKKMLGNIITGCLLLLLSLSSSAGAVNPDCSAKKAVKSTAMKATVGVGGRCSPAEAARDSAKGVVDVDDKASLGARGKNKNEDKDKEKKSLLEKGDDTKEGMVKKIIK